MISEKEAASQIARLSGLDFYPREASGLKELRLAGEAAASLSVLTQAVTTWLDNNTDAPKPAQLRSAVCEGNAKLQVNRSTCPYCDGSGWRIVKRGGLTGAAPCMCLPATHHARTGAA